MEEVAAQVSSIKRRLNGLVENCKKLFSSRSKDHRSTPTHRPSWVAQLCKSLDNISADLRTVKATLSTYSPRGDRLSRADTIANTILQIETQHGAPTQILCEATPPAVTESRQKTGSLRQEGRDTQAIPTTPSVVRDQVPPAATQSSEVVRSLRMPTDTHNRLSRTNTTAASTALNKPPAVIKRKRKATQTDIQASKPRVAPQISLLSEAIRGREAFHRLRTLVRSWRDRSTPLFELNKNNELAVQLVRVIGFGEERSPLIEFLNRFAKVKLADIIDSGKAGRSSADPQSLNELMDRLQWARTTRNRSRLHSYLKEGRR
ncbi:hypothetical protein WAI453_006486 [Rhynchosporium graminicola]